jgi:hypothetical protein
VPADEHHVALPKLYGAPAYARPPKPVIPLERPFDPDDLPIQVLQSKEEKALARAMPARSYRSHDPSTGRDGNDRNGWGLRPRPFSLRAIAGRVIRGR